MDLIFILFGLAAAAIFAFLLWRYNERNRYKDPNTVLRDVEIYQSDLQVPDYVSAQVLKKAIKLNPGHRVLIEKMDEVKKSKIT
jgi:hypothetical protein